MNHVKRGILGPRFPNYYADCLLGDLFDFRFYIARRTSLSIFNGFYWPTKSTNSIEIVATFVRSAQRHAALSQIATPAEDVGEPIL
jgi:hypothetical protein